MPILPSKKKLKPASSATTCLQALQSLTQNSNNSYSMLMQIVRHPSLIQTPSKSKIKNVTQNYFTPSTAQKSIQRTNKLSNYSTCTKLSVLRTKIQIRRKRIQQLTQKILKLTQYRFKINKYNIQILKSIQQQQQIKNLMVQQSIKLQQIKKIIQQIIYQKQQIQQQVSKSNLQLTHLQYKLTERQQTYKHCQQRYANINYAVQSQTRKNKNLITKLKQVKKQFYEKQYIKKFSRQLFLIFVLIIQRKNSKFINSNNNINSHKKKLNSSLNMSNVGIQQYENINLQDYQYKSLNKLPSTLVILCSVYMNLRQKYINKKYLNKISFFSMQIQKMFDLDKFRKLVRDYYELKCESNQIQVDYQIKDTQIIEQNEDFIAENMPKQIRMANLLISNNSNLKQLLTNQKQKQLLCQLLFKHFNIKIIDINSISNQSKMQFIPNDLRNQTINQVFLNDLKNIDSEENKLNMLKFEMQNQTKMN